MKTVGQALKEAREARFYTLEEVEKATKIRIELLRALEKDDYTKLPPSTFVQGFIKNYAKFLKIDPENLLAIFRRGFPPKTHMPYIMDAFSNPVEKEKIKLTPGRAFGAIIFLVILSFFIYLWFQYRQFVGTPTLSVISPPDQLTTDNASVIVEGKTDPEMKVSVNGQDISVSSGGDFKQDIVISQQVNKIIVSAISKFGQKTITERTVYLKR